MASDESSSPAPPTPSSSSSAGDSYIGSLISLTSKCEIRYEGILVSINPQEYTIALQNVRSYGTEGRKKDGPQIPPSDKVYEYILFRGSDIKDLQVKSSSPIHTKSQVHHDPAIIESHHAHASTSYLCSVSAGGGNLTGPSSHAAHSAVASPPLPTAYSLYQTGSQLGSWVSSAPPTNTNGASPTAPMYWQGYAGALSGQSPAQQHSVPFQLPSAMLQNQLQHPEGHAPTNMSTLSGCAAPLSFSSTAIPSQLAFSNPADVSPSLSSTTSLLSCPPSSLPSHLPTKSSFSSYNQELNATMNQFSSKAGLTATSILPFPSLPYSSSSIMGSSSGLLTTVPLLTPDQLTKFAPTESSSLLKLCPERKDMVALLPSPSSNLTSSVSALPQAPLLPLPLPSQQGPREVTRFNEEFDFTAMNEKFNKDEVWGSLGKSKQRGTTDGTEEDLIHDNIEVEEVCDQDPRFRSKPVYNKDDFFDTLSCNSLNQMGRTRFSERMRVDTETFGDFQQRPPLSRGNYGPAHAGNFRGRGYGYYRGGRGHGGYRPF